MQKWILFPSSKLGRDQNLQGQFQVAGNIGKWVPFVLKSPSTSPSGPAEGRRPTRHLLTPPLTAMGAISVMLAALQGLASLGLPGRIGYTLGLSLWTLLCLPTTPVELAAGYIFSFHTSFSTQQLNHNETNRLRRASDYMCSVVTGQPTSDYIEIIQSQ